MNAVEWMKSKARIETLEDGTVTYFFNGSLPARMIAEIKDAAQNRRDGGSEVAYSANGDTWGWSAVFGAYHSTASSIRFSFNDYTVPAQNS